MSEKAIFEKLMVRNVKNCNKKWVTIILNKDTHRACKNTEHFREFFGEM